MFRTDVRAPLLMLALAALGSAAHAAPPVPLVYECRTNGIGSPTYLRLDEALHSVSEGREPGKYMLTEPAIYNRDTVTWSRRMDGGQTWNFTFTRATGVLDYAWGTGPGEGQRDFCKKQ